MFKENENKCLIEGPIEESAIMFIKLSKIIANQTDYLHMYIDIQSIREMDAGWVEISVPALRRRLRCYYCSPPCERTWAPQCLTYMVTVCQTRFSRKKSYRIISENNIRIALFDETSLLRRKYYVNTYCISTLSNCFYRLPARMIWVLST